MSEEKVENKPKFNASSLMTSKYTTFSGVAVKKSKANPEKQKAENRRQMSEEKMENKANS